MIRIAISLVALSLLTSCVRKPPCPPCFSSMLFADFSATVERSEELRAELKRLLGALSSCEFSKEVRERVPGLERELGESEGSTIAECRCFDVVDASPQSNVLVSFELVPVSDCDGPLDRRYVVFASSVGGDRWLFSWPEELGVPLH